MDMPPEIFAHGAKQFIMRLVNGHKQYWSQKHQIWLKGWPDDYNRCPSLFHSFESAERELTNARAKL